MTRRAKERRAERVQEKNHAMEEHLRREALLSSRPMWRALLLRIDGGDEIAQSIVSPRHRQTESEALLSAPPASTVPDTVQWKSTNVPVAAATIFQLPITVEAPEATLQFEFSTRDYDINFGIQLLGADGKLVVVQSTRRYESHVKQVTGSVEIQGPVPALLIWDNSYSWLNVKQLAYSVELQQRFPDSGLDAAAVVTPAQRAALAVHERAKREKLRVHQEVTLSKIHATMHGHEQQIESITKQIEELQRTLEATEAAKDATIKEESQVNEEIASLTWEIDALLWRSMGMSAMHHIFSFCDDQTLCSWSITSRQWHQRIALARETGGIATAAKENAESPSP